MTVTFSHHRWSVAARVGALQASAAGAGEAEEAEELPGRGEPGTVGPEAGGRPPSRPEAAGEDGVRGEVAVPAVELSVDVMVPVDPVDPAYPDAAAVDGPSVGVP
ncbi:hypothetical protein AB0M11_07090 [Streptomyces sp. NPDC051987]|uniref:hypothetical protein n=1 Tax=Streptomyces sp. NPDC051987 TaxID=3155808 RepID=UPI003435CF35